VHLITFFEGREVAYNLNGHSHARLKGAVQNISYTKY